MRIRTALLLTPLLSSLVVAPLAGHAQTPSGLDVYAIVGAKVEVGDGRVLDKATVLIRNGRIEAVGPGVTVPPEAQVIKGDGLVVYPGFIDAHTTRGLQLPDAQPNQDTPPDTASIAPPFMREANRKGVRPEIQAHGYLALTDDILRPARQAGFTTEMVLPDGGTITGVGALVNLSGEPKRDCVVRPTVAMGFTFTSTGGRGFGGGGGGGGGGYPGSLMGITALTRQTLLDARRYEALQTAFASGGSQRPPDDPVLAALQPVIHGEMPVLYTAESENEIRRAVKMANEFGLKLMLSGATEAWKAAPLLADHKIPLLVSLDFGPDPTAPPTAFGGGPGGRGGFGRGGGGRNRPGGTTPSGPPGPGGTPRQTPPPSDPSLSGDPPADFVFFAPAAGPAGPGGAPQGTRPGSGGSPASPGGGGSPTPAEEDDTPRAYKQEQHRKWQEKVANAAALAKAGVPFAFTTKGMRSLPEFFTNLRSAIKAGLPRAAALRALTIDAARLFGVDRQLGTVEAGKTAALVVMSGDFDPDNDTGPLTPAPTRFFPADDDDNGGDR